VSRRKRPEPCPNPHNVFRVAIAFTAAGDAIIEKFGDQPPDCIEFPCAINRSFSLELYIKCLIILDKGIYFEDHNAKKAFNMLLPETRRQCEELYDQIRANDPLCKRESERLRRQGEDPEKYFKLKIALTRGALAFMQLRYPFETNISFDYALGPLELAARKVILDRKPEWNPALGQALAPIQPRSTSKRH
jgi:hypothetical protein